MTKKNVFSFILQFLLTMLVTYALVSLFNYFFLNKNALSSQPAEVCRGQSFAAPTAIYTTRPIVKEMQFVESKRSTKEVVTNVNTSWSTAVFSSEGAVLQRLDIHRELDGRASSITTIFPSCADDKENRCFVFALDQETPYQYHFEGKHEDDDAVTVTYAAPFEHGKIHKKFVVHKHTYQIDVTLQVKTNTVVRGRLLFPAPMMIDLQDKDIISGFALEGDKIKRFDYPATPSDVYWNKPTLFGASDRYFVNALMADTSDAVERAYFMDSREHTLLCCLESTEITGDTEWSWSFYMGPKDIDAMRMVNTRLEELVDYSGWFGPISIFMLKLLKFLHDYFHNFGVAIIMLTLLMRVAMLPLASSGEKQRKQRIEMDKKMKYIQQKYKDNPEMLNQKRLEVIREYGFGGMGCIMPLLQIPFFIGLNRLLSTSIELYRAPFVPGWISDLSSSDPYYILPILFGIGMMITAVQGEPSQRTTFLIMAVVLSVLFSSFAAGLVLFFVVSMYSGIISAYAAKKLNWS